MTTFAEQSHPVMPPPGWLHVNGVSLSTDVHQQSDQRMKYETSPHPPLFSPPNALMINDGLYHSRQYQKFENVDMPKKLFLDRQIKKAKSLPGLIKGTALSHHHSASYTNPVPTHAQQEDLLQGENEEDLSPPIHSNYEQIVETRRPRVSFSDKNKVQYFEEINEASPQSSRRRHRYRSSKKNTPLIANNQVSPPSIQHSQSLYTPYRPLSRQQPIGYELNIKKQQLIPSPRAHSSRLTHLPDILNQTIPNETPLQEKYTLQREKTLFHFPEPTAEITMNSSTEISRESTRAGGIRPLATQDYYDPNEMGINSFLNSSSFSSSLTSRHRPRLRTISLRHQFTTPTKSKPSTNTYPTPTNPRRSASLKHPMSRNHSVDDDQEEIHQQNFLSTYEHRPMTGLTSSKHLKRNYVIHFNSKNPLNGNTIMDSNEITHPSIKTNFHEVSPSRFQNVLKIGRPPYITNLQNSHHDPSPAATSTHHLNGSIRSSRTNSGPGSREFHLPSNTIYV